MDWAQAALSGALVVLGAAISLISTSYVARREARRNREWVLYGLIIDYYAAAADARTELVAIVEGRPTEEGPGVVNGIKKSSIQIVRMARVAGKGYAEHADRVSAGVDRLYSGDTAEAIRAEIDDLTAAVRGLDRAMVERLR